jgi:hypothetical protein
MAQLLVQEREAVFVGQGLLPARTLGCTGTFGKNGIDIIVNGHLPSNFETMRRFKS